MYTSCGIESDPLFVSTVMNNGDPKSAQIIKLVNADWGTQTAKKFMEDIQTRAASGVFNTKASSLQ